MNKKQKVLLTSTILVLLIIASMPIAMAASYDFSVSPNNDYVYLGLSEEEGYFEFSYIPYGDYELYLLGKKNSMSWMIGKATVSVVSSEVQNVTINWVVADSNNMTEVNYCWGLVNYFGKLEPVIYPLDPDSPTIKGDLNVPDGFITTVYLVRVNQHPYAPELSSSVDTTNPTVGTPLAVNVTGPNPADPNSDSVTYSYDWFVDTGEGYVADEEAGRGDHTTATVRSADTLAGDIWKVEVTATDYYGLQSQTVSEFVFPELEAPPEEFVTVNKSVKISCITVDDDSTYMIREAVSMLNLTDQEVNISVYGFSRDDTVNMSYVAPENVDLSDSDVIVLLSGAMSSQSASVEDDLIAIVEETKKDDAIIIDLGDYGLGTVDLEEHPYLEDYWTNYYTINTKRMLMYILINFCDGAEGYVEDPISVPMNGLYHPDLDRPSFDTLEEYMEWYSTDDGTHHVYNQNNTTIGITFMLNTNGDIGDRAVDDLIRRLEARGVNVIPVHCHWMLYMSTSDYFKYEDKWLVDAFIDMGFGAMATSAVYNIDDLEEANVPVINAIEYEGTIEEWENSTTGRSYYFQYQIPIMEIGGEIESIVVSGKKLDEEYDAYVDEPIPAQMEWMINRTLNWIKLKSTENEDRKVALIYYHNSPGRDSVTTATNLNSPRSIVALLEGMEERGYTLGNNGTPNETELLDLIEYQGRNIGSWAPDELETIVSTNETELMPVEEYMEMFSRLPESCQDEVTEIWGEAPGNLMVYENESGKYFVFPKITLGNVILTPQPTRGGTNNSTILYHDQTTPPDHHYIAFYLWLQKQYEADVVIHFGQHGTQEWLKGKGVGLSATEDWPAIVIGDMPVVYIYNVGGISEGSVAKRRGNCVIVDHATPAIQDAGLYGNLTNLHDKIHLYEEADQDNDSIKYDYRESIIEIYDSLGFENNEWGVSVEELTEMTEEEFEAFVIYGEVHSYLHELASENIWIGLHTLGKNLEGENLTSMVHTMLGSSFKENVAEVYEGDDELLEAANENNTLDKMLADLLLNGLDPEEILQTHLNVTPRAYSTVAGVTNTDENGSFSFTNLEGGDGVNYTVYALEELSGNEFLIGEILPEINESGNTACEVEMTYANGQEYNGILANLSGFGDASLSGHVWYYSGMYSENRTYENVTVLLLEEGSVKAVDRTDANGNFSFINLPAGTYTLKAYYCRDLTDSEMGSIFYYIDQEITEHELGEGDNIENYQLQVSYSGTTEEEYNELLSLTGNASLSGQAYYTSGGERVNSTALVILGKEAFGYTVKEQKVMDDLETAITYAENLQACEGEIESVLDALEGQYISPALGDDPIRSPSVLPTGNNFYAFNPYLIPSEETWNQGVELADELLEEWKEENDGEYPTKIGFVLWSAETLRHKGVMESEILYLMGVRPVWENGVFSDVEIIPDEELTHPRIDVVVTITGVYRDTWELQVKMMDRAVAKVSEMDESDSTWHNYVKENSDGLYEYLNGTGNYTQEEAKSLSMDRVFGPDIGMYEVGSMGSAMSQSDTWNGNDSMLAELYLSNMAYVYGEDVWGQHEPELFKKVLSGTEAILFSRSGNDGRGSSGVVFDHVTTFYGGLALAIKEIDGEYPEMYIVDLRDTDNMGTVTFVEYLYTELRSTYNNPTYISGLMGEGYAGAAEILSILQDLAALDYTTGAVTDDMWQQIYNTYVLDSNDLGLEEWFATSNPYAMQSVYAQMIEAIRTGYWDASDEVLENLANKYLEAKETYGPCCCVLCCGNVLLDDYANGHATSHQVLDNPSNDISSSSSGGSSTGGATIVPANNNENQESMSNQSSNSNDGGYGTDTSLASTPDNHVEGNIMQSETTANQNSQSSSGGMSASGVAILGTVAVLLILTVFYMGFRRN